MKKNENRFDQGLRVLVFHLITQSVQTDAAPPVTDVAMGGSEVRSKRWHSPSAAHGIACAALLGVLCAASILNGVLWQPSEPAVPGYGICLCGGLTLVE